MITPTNSHQPLRIHRLIHFPPLAPAAKRRCFRFLVDGDGIQVSQVDDDGVLDEWCPVVAAASEGDRYSVA